MTKTRDIYHTVCGVPITARLLFRLSAIRLVSETHPEEADPAKILALNPDKLWLSRNTGKKVFNEFLTFQRRLRNLSKRSAE